MLARTVAKPQGTSQWAETCKTGQHVVPSSGKPALVEGGGMSQLQASIRQLLPAALSRLGHSVA